MFGLEINDRTKGFLPLILILLFLYALRAGINPSISPGSQCNRRSYLQIEGDVRFPGIYTSCHEANLMDLIDRAGGLLPLTTTPEAFRHFTFASGSRVIVDCHAKRCRFFQNEMSAFYKVTLGIPVSLNRESEEGLSALPGIGPGLARAIVHERLKRGGFKRLDEVTSIQGIGHSLYEKIRPYLKL